MVKLNNLKLYSILLIILLNIVIFGSYINNNNRFITSNESDNILDSKTEKSSLNVANVPPDIPQLNYPLNESFHTSNLIKFEWNPVGKSSDDIFYEFLLDNNSDFSSPEAARFAINNWSNSTMSEEPYTIFLAHFNDTLNTEDSEIPLVSNGISFVPGKFGKGAFINASANAALGYNINGNFNLSKGTIEFWVKLEKDLADAADYLFFFDYVMTLPPNITRFSILVSPDLKKIYAVSAINGTYYNLVPNRKQDWKAGEWHQICMTWGDELASLYLDGIEEAVSTYFPIGTGSFENIFRLGSQVGPSNWINATYDEVRISSIQRIPIWNPENSNVNVTYFGLPIQRYPIWSLNKSEYTHIFEKDGCYYWKVRVHNKSGPGEWSETRILTINRLLDKKYSLGVKILDKNGISIPNANLSYQQETYNKLMGVDANYGVELIDGDCKWYHKGSEIDIYEFLGSRKSNSFRTRLWTNVGGKNSLINATKMAKWAQDNGSIPYLTIFLSDKWAAIDNQPLPTIFDDLNFKDRLVEIEEYCKNVTQHFKDVGINMEFYEIGNEIDFGICGIYATDKMPRYNLTWLKENIWYNESRIIKASINGVRQVDPDAKFMLHIALSDPAFALAFYTAMEEFGVPYDIIGLSYHPVAAGDAAENAFKETYKILSTSGLPGSDKIILPETSYSSQINGSTYFTSFNHSITEFPLTPEGQKNWIKYQLEWIYQHPNIAGMNYWSPEYYWDPEYQSLVWEGFSWFNKTGGSKPAVDAYPEFYNIRSINLSGWEYSNSQGMIFIEAYRGFLDLKIQYDNHIEYFNIIITPFRDNIFTIKINIILPQIIPIADDDGDDDKEEPIAIPSFDIILIICLISIITVILTQKQNLLAKAKKK